MWWNNWTRFGICAAACALGILVMAAGKPRNPPVDPAKTLEAAVDVPPRVHAVLRRACYDCHSYETRWPWYTRIPPATGMMAADVENARQVMNFSDWPPLEGQASMRAAGLLLAACAGIQSGRMPRPRYLLLHPEARLAPQDVDALCSWSQAEAKAIMVAYRKAREAAGE
jgi:hypothetical protein